MKQKTEKIKLKLPSLEMANQAMAFRAEFLACGEKINGSGRLHRYEQFKEWLRDIHRSDAELPEGEFPSVTYFAMRLPDGLLVGVANIRCYLTEKNYHNGHIGYAVRPSERRKGYGSEILRQALIKAEQLGILETLVCCDKDNEASKRVIAKNKLRFENEFYEDNGNTILIYRQQ